jgi:hypothetical protein
MAQLTGVNKMSEIKTVTHEGQVYEIGKDYLFSDTKGTWVYSKLLGIESDDISPFKTYILCWKFIKDMPPSEEFGTITPAPVPLINGKAYTFNCEDSNDFVGVYDKACDDFIGIDNKDCDKDCTSVKIIEAKGCTNIRLMTVESK